MKLKEHVQIQILFNKEWHNIDLENLRKDNIIRVFRNYKLDKDQYGFTIRKCICDAWQDKNESWNIQSVGIKLDENMKEIKDTKNN